MTNIYGIGVDLVDIHRIAALRERHGDHISGHIFLPDEIAYCLSTANPDESLAARFAAKEAVMKALGTGWTEGVHFMGIEVTREENGRPGITLHGTTREKAVALGIGKIHLSLSHSKDLAIAHVIAEKIH